MLIGVHYCGASEAKGRWSDSSQPHQKHQVKSKGYTLRLVPFFYWVNGLYCRDTAMSRFSGIALEFIPPMRHDGPQHDSRHSGSPAAAPVSVGQYFHLLHHSPKCGTVSMWKLLRKRDCQRSLAASQGASK